MKPCLSWAVHVALLASGVWSPLATAGAPSNRLVPRVSMAGRFVLPDQAPRPDGSPQTITGLSGITWLGDDRYAAIMDNSDCLMLLRIKHEPDGVPTAVHDVRLVVLGHVLDYEDVAPCPERLSRGLARDGARPQRECLLACEEATPAIHVVDIDSGTLIGAVAVPSTFKSRRPNRGLEALSVEPNGRAIWTANEEAMPADGPPPTDQGGTVVRLTRIEISNDSAADAGRTTQFAYAVDPPHRFVRMAPGDALSGVVAVVALGDGRCLVLERSWGPGMPTFESRAYLVDVMHAPDVAGIAGGLAERADLHVAKTLLWQDALGWNLEGLCSGPALARGGRLLVGVADNGGLGTPNQLVTLVLQDEPRAVEATWMAAAAGIAGAIILVLRMRACPRTGRRPQEALTSPSPCSTR